MSDIKRLRAPREALRCAVDDVSYPRTGWTWVRKDDLRALLDEQPAQALSQHQPADETSDQWHWNALRADLRHAMRRNAPVVRVSIDTVREILRVGPQPKPAAPEGVEEAVTWLLEITDGDGHDGIVTARTIRRDKDALRAILAALAAAQAEVARLKEELHDSEHRQCWTEQGSAIRRAEKAEAEVARLREGRDGARRERDEVVRAHTAGTTGTASGYWYAMARAEKAEAEVARLREDLEKAADDHSTMASQRDEARLMLAEEREMREELRQLSGAAQQDWVREERKWNADLANARRELSDLRAFIIAKWPCAYHKDGQCTEPQISGPGKACAGAGCEYRETVSRYENTTMHDGAEDEKDARAAELEQQLTNLREELDNLRYHMNAESEEHETLENVSPKQKDQILNRGQRIAYDHIVKHLDAFLVKRNVKE
jgi:hypothetical protein